MFISHISFGKLCLSRKFLSPIQAVTQVCTKLYLLFALEPSEAYGTQLALQAQALWFGSPGLVVLIAGLSLAWAGLLPSCAWSRLHGPCALAESFPRV